MILFQYIANILDAFIFPYFLFQYFEPKLKNEFILLSGTIQFFILTFFNYYQYNNTILTFIIISFNLLSFYLIYNKITLENIFITIVYSFIIFSTTISGLVIKEIIVNLHIITFHYEINAILGYLAGKMILISITILFIKLKQSFSISLEMSKWKLIIFFEFILMFLVVIIGYTISTNRQLFQTFYILLLCLILLNILFIFIILKINQLNNKYLEHLKEKQCHQFNDEKLSLIKNIKNEIDAIDHRLFYIIYKIDDLLENNEIDKIHQLLNQYKSILIKKDMIINTGNTIFDCLISLKLNDLMNHHIAIKTCIFISVNDIYDQFIFIDLLTKLLDYFYLCHEIELFINENYSHYITIQILYDNDLDINNVHTFLSTMLIQLDGRYTFNEQKKYIKMIIPYHVKKY